MRMRTAILLLLVIAVAPSLLVQAGVYYYWLRTNEAREFQSERQLSRSLAATFDSYVRDLAQYELTLATALTARWPYPLEEMNALFRVGTADYPALNAFLFLNPDGQIVASSDPRLLGISAKDREYFQRALATKDFVLSDLLEGRMDPNPIFIVARAVYHGDQLVGVLSGSVNPDRLWEATLKCLRSEGGSASFFDRQGTLVYRCPFRPLTWPDRKAPESGELLQQALSGREAVGVFRSGGDNTVQVGARVPIANLGWVAGTSESKAVFMRPLWRSLFLVALVNVVVVAISLAGAWFISRGMRESIGRLRRQALAVGEGRLDETLPEDGIGELADLAVAFNEMVCLRKQAVEVEAKYRSLVEESLVGVYLVQGVKFVYVNPRLADIFGYAQEEIAGVMRVEDLVIPADRPLVAESMRQRISGEIQSAHYTFRGLRKNNRIIDVEVIGSLTVYGGKPAVIGTLLDITERKRAEDELKRMAAELARSNHDLEQFARIASHDLQEPLRMVTGHLHIVERHAAGSLDEVARESMEFAVDGAARMQNLIRDLLAYSRVGRGGEGFVETDMETALNEAMKDLKTSMEEAGAAIGHDPLPRVKAESTLMKQLLQNLLGNAVKYRAQDQRPEIHVGARRDGQTWTFWVRDNGIGIAPEDSQRIFMIFERLHGRGEYPGTGIGLAICKRIIDHHGGHIWVESRPGQGATFFFTIPDRA